MKTKKQNLDCRIAQTKEADAQVGRLSERLEQANQVFRALQHAINEHAIVAITDAKGKITCVNEKFCAISGFSEAELIGQDHRIINSGYHPKSFFRDMYKTISSGKVWHGDICNRSKTGEIYWVKSTFVPSLDENGKVQSYTAIRDDITLLKKIEAELGQVVAQLKARSSEIDRKNSEMEQLVYTVSHDLKSPLVTILGFASHIGKDLEDHQPQLVLEDTERIIRAASKLKLHIEELLELGRIGRARQPLEMVDLESAVAEVLSECDAALKQRGVQVVTKFEVASVLVDRYRLLQVLQNLVANALKHGCAAVDPRIEIGSVAHDDEVRIFVRDNGNGIAEQHHERIFGLFQHLGTRSDSSGVGLAHVRRIAEVHGGRAWVESSIGAGAVFWVSLSRFPTPAESNP